MAAAGLLGPDLVTYRQSRLQEFCFCFGLRGSWCLDISTVFVAVHERKAFFFRQTCCPFGTIQRPITISAQLAVRTWRSRWFGTYFCCFGCRRANPDKMVSSLSRHCFRKVWYWFHWRFEHFTLLIHYRKYPCCWRLSHRGLGRYGGDAQQLIWV